MLALAPTAVRCAETTATARSRLFVANGAPTVHRHVTIILAKYSTGDSRSALLETEPAIYILPALYSVRACLARCQSFSLDPQWPVNGGCSKF
jgi:hypothetical protein